MDVGQFFCRDERRAGCKDAPVNASGIQSRPALIPAGKVDLRGELTVPPAARGLVVFAHGSGSGRRSPRNQAVARCLQGKGLGTLLFDLLTEEEERLEYQTRHLRFDIPLLAERLIKATAWAGSQTILRDLPIGYFGASTGAAAALVAAAQLGDGIRAVVSRGGRPDLAGKALPKVKAATLLIVGGHDTQVIELNVEAHSALRCQKQLTIVPSATHLFEEPGALERVAQLAAEWFLEHLIPQTTVQP
jgi:pimeloyl-ACP methyl ester carboxylesterase